MSCFKYKYILMVDTQEISVIQLYFHSYFYVGSTYISKMFLMKTDMFMLVFVCTSKHEHVLCKVDTRL